MTEGIELSNQEKITTFREKENLHVLGNIKSGHHQTNGDKKKIFKSISGEREN